MRKALFAVMLIGASFAGGAVVNGPGLRWAQTMILSHLNGDGDNADEDEDALSTTVVQEPLAPIPSEPLAPNGDVASASSPSGKEDPKTAAPRPGSESGSRGSASAVADASPSPAGDRPQPAAPEPPQSKSEESPASKAMQLLGDAHRSKPSDDPAIALANVPTPLPEGGPPPMEPLDPLPPLNEPGAASSSDQKDKDQAKEKEKEPAWADAPGSAPAAAVPPRPYEPPDSSASPRPAQAAAPAPASIPDEAANATAAPAPRGSSDWAEIRRKMAALGVSRYGIEGEPNGRVRFHCVIPLAGRRAVAQQFEAEGDDELQAAEVALRRVALWRATENPGP